MPAEQTSLDLWTSFQRVVTICTTTDLDEEAADEVRTFLNEVAATPDLIVLFDARGRSVWSSVELPQVGLRAEWDGATILRMHLCRVLMEMVPGRDGGDAMELG
jgi:hypothetical protein